jgi:hypothetical protein
MITAVPCPSASEARYFARALLTSNPKGRRRKK